MDNIVASTGQCHDSTPRTQRSPPLRPGGGRGQLQPRRRAPGPPQVDGVPPRGGTGGATRRAPAAAHHPQAHRHRLRPQRARACASRRRRGRGGGFAGPESTSRAQRAVAGVHALATWPIWSSRPLLAEFVLAASGHCARGGPVGTVRRPGRRELRRRHPDGRLARRRVAGRAPPGGVHRRPLCVARLYRAARRRPPSPRR